MYVPYRGASVPKLTTINRLRDSLKEQGVSISARTLRNQKGRLAEAGITILTEKQYEAILKENGPTEDLFSGYITEQEYQEQYKSNGANALKEQINSICKHYKLPQAFPESSLSLDSVENCYNSAAESLKNWKDLGLSIDEYAIVSKVIRNTYRPMQDLTVPDDHRGKVTTLFQNQTGNTPSEEQIRTIFGMFCQLTARYHFQDVPFAVVQSVAGASKTTCSLITAMYIEQELGHNIYILTATNGARISGRSRSITISKFLNIKAGENIVGKSATDIRECFESFAHDDVIEKESMIIVDEFSLADPEIIDTIKLLGTRILFVGDLAQLTRSARLPGTVILSLRETYRWFGGKGNALTAQISTDLRLNNNFDDMREYLVDLAFRTAPNTKMMGMFAADLKASTDVRSNSTRLTSTYENAFTDYIDLIKSYTELDQQIVTYATEAVRVLNRIVNDGDTIKPGSKVIIEKQEITAPRAIKGSIWKVHSVNTKEGLCTITQEQVGDYQTLPLSSVSLGFCITTFKAQGSQWDYVLSVTGTANKENLLPDTYVLLTRAVEETKVLFRSGTEEGERVLLEIHRPDFKSLSKQSQHIKSYEATLITLSRNTLSEETNKRLLARVQEQKLINYSNKQEPVIPAVLSEPTYKLLRYYPETGKILYPPKRDDGKDKLPLYQAQYAQAEAAKRGITTILCANLQHSNMVVIDCDSKEAVEAFIHLADTTEAWVNDDQSSMHLVFKTDSLYPTEIKSTTKGVDFLGNLSKTDRHIKPNKKWNGKEATLLTNDIYQYYKSFVTGDV